MGFEPNDRLTDPTLAPKARALTQKGRVLFDEQSRPEFGPVAEWFKSGRTVESEIAGNGYGSLVWSVWAPPSVPTGTC